MIKEPDLFISSGHMDREAAETLNNLFLQAAVTGASDIHLLTSDGMCEVRFRVNGILRSMFEYEGHLSKLIDDKIRARANLSSADRHVALDGRFRLRYPEKAIDVRVSIAPNVAGQLCVCRLLDNSNSARSLDTIEMTPMVRHCLDEMIEEPNGLLLVCGPTGSGKTTLLYSILNALHSGERNLVTIENPVEYRIAGVHQINVDQHITFPKALRAVLRQDPDVILVGEIRDEETAEIALQAANTGHFVIATLHANDSAMAITRMLDFGVDQQTLAAALRGVVAQRLVQKVASSSEFEWKSASETQIAWMNQHGVVSSGMKFPSARSVTLSGRLPVIEMLRVDAAMRNAIVGRHGQMALLNVAARQAQFETLAMAGIRLASRGLTTMEEVQRTVGVDAVVPESTRLGQVLVNQGKAQPEHIHAAVARQVQLRKRGELKMLGEILVSEGVCSVADVVMALGYTEGAPDAASYFVVQEKMGQKELVAAVKDWRANHAGESLFDLLVGNGFLKQEDLYEPSIIFCAGRCNGCTAGDCKRLNQTSSTVQRDTEVA